MILSNELLMAIKGSIIQVGIAPVMIDHILTDSRKVSHPASSVFFPLITARRNAHEFINAVYQSGVRCFVVSQDIRCDELPDAWIYRAKNTLTALQQLATWHRQKFQYPVIGITGSNGKTIVKEMLAQLLEPDFNLVRSPRSFNSQLGVPLSVWQMQSAHNLAIIEAGISQAGEMENLERIIQPDIGLFTNIGETHNEGFLNLRHKINEKLQLFKHAQRLIYCKDYPELHDAILQFAGHHKKSGGHQLELFSWSRKSDADLQIVEIRKENTHSEIHANFRGASFQWLAPFTDDAYLENVIASWFTALILGCDPIQLAQRILKLQASPMRLELVKGINNCTLINDSYSSDVSSFAIALDFLMQQNQHDRRTVILSDMLQTGRDSEIYDEVYDLIRQKKIDRLIGIGESMMRNKSVFRKNRRLESQFYKSTRDFLENVDTSEFQNESILIKGARRFEFETIAQRLQERIHQTVLEINLCHLVHNLKVYQNLLKPQTQVMAMVKALSYGSGSFEIANKLQFEGVSYLAVAYTDEGIALRKNKIDLPILVMNPDLNSFPYMLEWKLEPEIYNFKSLHQLLSVLREKGALAFPVHLKLDTGMHRLGFEEEQLPDLLEVIQSAPEMRVVSVFSHLSGSEEVELDAFTAQQAANFIRMADVLEQGMRYRPMRHLCNSSGIARHPELHFDMVRLGLGLYGIDGSFQIQSQLKNVSTLKTTIAQIKLVSRHDTVGYNRKGVLDRDTLIGTVCIGYADGIPRRLGNGRAYMMVNGKQAPIVGNVCMDMCMLDITDIPGVQEGDPVEVFGAQLAVTELAQRAETIPYEILTGISHRVKRIYLEE
ncbi:MAG: bifunctional UDP-N-acetylmuramoyl-tripeptide:D-alanyl-D-alanine ligase/alanine racemase [Chitinophagaceae bacterium]|nr:bifunctional UDP-N-acetylmuramoyl-tripeptide:D-alanyl-D-alanine ligase/alanine racemase [Chitinophagaceae bacterium]